MSVLLHATEGVMEEDAHPLDTRQTRSPVSILVMEEARCSLCSGEVRVAAHALTAPWIDELCDQEVLRPSVLVACDPCNFSYFLPLMSDETAAKLYKQYREPSYFKARRRWEPWYRTSWNSSRDPGTSGAIAAQSEIDALLKGMPDSVFAIVADIGGDLGQFFPRRSKRRLLVEPSDRHLVPNVERCPSIQELPASVSLVVLGCVLPHVSDPVRFLSQIIEACPRAVVAIQMARDTPRLHGFHSAHLYYRYLRRIANNRIAFTSLDFISGLCRQIDFAVPRFGVVKQSEHINYFSVTSLTLLAQRCGYKISYVHEGRGQSLGSIRVGSLSAVLYPDGDGLSSRGSQFQ